MTSKLFAYQPLRRTTSSLAPESNRPPELYESPVPPCELPRQFQSAPHRFRACYLLIKSQPLVLISSERVVLADGFEPPHNCFRDSRPTC